MARRKRPENETPDQAYTRQTMETITNSASRNEKVSWDRKMDNMVKLIAKIRPIEDQILELISQKQPLMDEITTLRAEMVKDCIHPTSHVITVVDPRLGSCAECKFCGRRFVVQDI